MPELDDPESQNLSLSNNNISINLCEYSALRYILALNIIYFFISAINGNYAINQLYTHCKDNKCNLEFYRFFNFQPFIYILYIIINSSFIPRYYRSVLLLGIGSIHIIYSVYGLMEIDQNTNSGCLDNNGIMIFVIDQCAVWIAQIANFGLTLLINY